MSETLTGQNYYPPQSLEGQFARLVASVCALQHIADEAVNDDEARLADLYVLEGELMIVRARLSVLLSSYDSSFDIETGNTGIDL